MTTFEEKYRAKNRTDAAPASPAAHVPAMEMLKAAAQDEYKAYNAFPHQELELWIRPNAANERPDVYLPYSYRNHTLSDGKGFFISMHYNTPIITVTIHGRNLQELAHLLPKRQVEWVKEYDAREHGELAAGAPCITGIEIKHAPRQGKKDDDTQPGEDKKVEGAATH